MSTTSKVTISLVLAVVIAVAIYGGYQYPRAASVVTLGSAVGSTFNDAKIEAVNMSPATSAASSTSILNTDGSARWVTSSFARCSGVGSSKTYLTGAGLAAWKLRVSTTTTAAQTGNSKYSANLSLATSTSFIGIASTTNAYYAGNWASGSYMNFTFNATNTAACIVGVNYLGS